MRDGFDEVDELEDLEDEDFDLSDYEDLDDPGQPEAEPQLPWWRERGADGGFDLPVWDVDKEEDVKVLRGAIKYAEYATHDARQRAESITSENRVHAAELKKADRLRETTSLFARAGVVKAAAWAELFDRTESGKATPEAIVAFIMDHEIPSDL
jgi:hypothetical protein